MSPTWARVIEDLGATNEMGPAAGRELRETHDVPASFAFLPGASGHGSFWDPVATALGAENGVFLDWPGFADMPADPAVASYDDLASLVVARLTGPTVLVAQSMGGVVAVRVAQRRPDLVSHLVLAVTSGGIDLTPFTAQDWRVRSRAASPNNPLWMWDPLDDLSPVLAALPMKTLLLWATDDEISPLPVGQHLATLIPRSQLVAFASDDHWVARTHAEDVARTIAGFVTPSIGFLHTAEVHIATFEGLLDAESMEELRTAHVVDEGLLAAARELGVNDATVRDAVAEALRDLVDEGVDVIVCTCSTIGGVAEQAQGCSVPVLRVDRPMVATAVATARRIAVVAALESTLTPTRDLLVDECERQGRTPGIDLQHCAGAWSWWEAGDVDGYHRAVAEHVNSLDDSFDVVVLAQASMLGALTYVTERPGRVVLSSPLSALRAAVVELHRGVKRTASPRGES